MRALLSLIINVSIIKRVVKKNLVLVACFRGEIWIKNIIRLLDNHSRNCDHLHTRPVTRANDLSRAIRKRKKKEEHGPHLRRRALFAVCGRRAT